MAALWITVAVLGVLVLCEGVALLALARELALLARRVPAEEALDLDGGPELGRSVRNFEATDFDGNRWALADQDTDVLLLFVAESCQPCRGAMRETHLVQRDWPDLMVVPVVTGNVAEARLMKRHAPNWTGPVLVDSLNFMHQLEIPVTPFGLVVHGGTLVGRGIVNDRDSASSLIEGRIRMTDPAEWQFDVIDVDARTTNTS